MTTSDDAHRARSVMAHKRVDLLLIIMIVGVLLAVSWLLGERHGAQQAMSVASSRMSSIEAQSEISELNAALRAKQIELEAANNRGRINASRLETLTNQLDAQMRQNLTDANDLELYRQIENSENARSIDIATLRRRSEQPLTIEMTLVQWQGRDRISGEAHISLEYLRTPDSAVKALEQPAPAATLPEAEPTMGLEDTYLMVDLESVTFDFRFFQHLTLSVDSGDDQAADYQGTAPQAVVVRVAPTDERLKPVEKRFLWIDIVE